MWSRAKLFATPSAVVVTLTGRQVDWFGEEIRCGNAYGKYAMHMNAYTALPLFSYDYQALNWQYIAQIL